MSRSMGPVSRWTDLDRPPLDVQALNRALVDGGLWRELRVVDETGSTNADVAELARSGEAEGLVLVAEHQSAGRGRLGRVWRAPARSGLSFSVLLRPVTVPAGRWPLVPLLVGVGVARAVARVTDIEISLKWPNDLLVGGRKLGGILAEWLEPVAAGGQAEPAGAIGPAIVVGVGLNVTLREPELPVPTAISLSGDSSWRAPMGITVIGGLTLSTVLTLLIVPAAFSLAVGAERWIGPRLGRRLLSYQPGDEGTPVIDQRPGPRPIGYGSDEDAPQPAE